VRVSHLVEADFEEELFKDTQDFKKEQVHRALDKIKEKFGDNAIYRAARTFKH
jgi:oligoribonuclease (3'-5' exoribonuclease)